MHGDTLRLLPPHRWSTSGIWSKNQRQGVRKMYYGHILCVYLHHFKKSIIMVSISVKRQENKVFHHGSSLINYCLLNLMLTDPQRMYYLLLPTMESPIFYHHCNLLIEDICSSEAATRCLVRPCSPACSLHQQYSTLWSRVIQRLQFSSVSGHRCRHQHLQ